MLRALSSLAVMMVFLGGCATMAPDYSRPESPVPGEWPSGAAYKAGAGRLLRHGRRGHFLAGVF